LPKRAQRNCGEAVLFFTLAPSGPVFEKFTDEVRFPQLRGQMQLARIIFVTMIDSDSFSSANVYATPWTHNTPPVSSFATSPSTEPMLTIVASTGFAKFREGGPGTIKNGPFRLASIRRSPTRSSAISSMVETLNTPALFTRTFQLSVRLRANDFADGGSNAFGGGGLHHQTAAMASPAPPLFNLRNSILQFFQAAGLRTAQLWAPSRAKGTSAINRGQIAPSRRPVINATFALPQT